MKIETAAMSSPVGRLAVAWSDGTILALHMDVAESRTTPDTTYAPGGPMRALKESLIRRFPGAALERGRTAARPLRALERYFRGDLGAIDGLSVDPGGTEFQAAVWEALRDVPAGETRTYGELAAAVGHPGSARAAGGAVGSNPVPIVVPCHRIVGSNGRLTGFGGGLKHKRWLLRHEGVALAATAEPLRLF